ncbi:unnamed protein product [Ectocarpus sp. CCAP 1310/34]|nr:unnamed protein product [Ectocarpus sp. CCAP 1310/34]
MSMGEATLSFVGCLRNSYNHKGAVCRRTRFAGYPSIDFYLNRYTFAYGVSDRILVRISLGAHFFS